MARLALLALLAAVWLLLATATTGHRLAASPSSSSSSSTGLDSSSSSENAYNDSSSSTGTALPVSSSSSSSSSLPRPLRAHFNRLTLQDENSQPTSLPAGRRNSYLHRIQHFPFRFWVPGAQVSTYKRDPLAAVFVLFGGETASTGFNDIYLFGNVTTNNWDAFQLIKLSNDTLLPPPYNRSFPAGRAMAYCGASSDDALFAMCGNCNDSATSDTLWYSSSDDTRSRVQQWSARQHSGGWVAREQAVCHVDTSGNMYHIAGSESSSEGSNLFNTVWRSNDRANTWFRTTDNPSFSPRNRPSVVSYYSKVFNSHLVYVIGGEGATQYLNDVHVSRDSGLSWAQVTGSAQWAARGNPSVASTTDGAIVLAGGSRSTDAFFNDVWLTIDGGYQWTQLNAAAEFTGRYAFPSAFDGDGYLYVLSGGGASVNSDGWRSRYRFTDWDILSRFVYGVEGNVTAVGLQVWPSNPVQPNRPSTSNTNVEGIMIGLAAFLVIVGGFALYKFVDWKNLPCQKHRWIQQSQLALTTNTSASTLNQQLLAGRSDRASFVD